jgi:hypothetical protein
MSSNNVICNGMQQQELPCFDLVVLLTACRAWLKLSVCMKCSTYYYCMITTDDVKHRCSDTEHASTLRDNDVHVDSELQSVHTSVVLRYCCVSQLLLLSSADEQL